MLNIFLLGSVFLLLLLLSLVWPPDAPWAPWWRTNAKKARAVCRLAKIKKGEVIYDLGSGDGTVLVIAAKEFGATGIGIEIDPLRFFISKINFMINGMSANLKVKRKDFFNEDLKNADVIFVYLIPKTLEKLIPKFKKELKKGTKIVSYVYEANLPLKDIDSVNNLKLYII